MLFETFMWRCWGITHDTASRGTLPGGLRFPQEMSGLKIGILGSGKGTNLQAIIEAVEAGRLHGEVRVAISDVEGAYILERAKKHGIDALYLPAGPYMTKLTGQAEEVYIKALQERGVEWVALAGFMRVIKEPFLKAFHGQVVNIHPSLLPAFKGLEAWKQALDYGVKVTGCTVHFVDQGMDSGPIILQAPVEVKDDDTPESLHQRIQKEEHRLYPQALQLIAQGCIKVRGRKVTIAPPGERIEKSHAE